MNNKEEVKNEEVKETEEKKDEKQDETQKNNEGTQKINWLFPDTMRAIWNSKPMKFVRKTVKVTLITGAALIGVTGAAKAGAAMALEEHDAKSSDSEETPDEIPGDYEEVPDETEEIHEDSES